MTVDGRSVVNNKTLGSLVGHTETIETVGLSPDLQLGASGSLDKKLIVWDLNTLTVRSTLVHGAAISCLKWIPGSPCVYSASIDGAVRLWDARAATCQRIAWGHTKGILDLATSPNRTAVVSGGDDCTARIFKFAY